jgi:uncharacterized protein YbcI
MAQPQLSPSDREGHSPLLRISDGLVGLLSETFGRGPTKAKTYLLDNYVLCVFEDLLTTTEETMLSHGREDLVRKMRLEYQDAMSDQFTGVVESALGRKVLTYQSQITFDPPIAFEIFVLAPAP